LRFPNITKETRLQGRHVEEELIRDLEGKKDHHLTKEKLKGASLSQKVSGGF